MTTAEEIAGKIIHTFKKADNLEDKFTILYPLLYDFS